MVEMGLRLVLAGVLAGAAIAKLANPSAGREALAGFGFESPAARAIGFWSLIAIELGLAAGLIAGSTEAAILGAGLMAMFALVMAGAIARGRAGEPCGCFGARSRIGWAGVVRNFALAAGFIAVAVLPSEDLTTDQWLGLGLIGALGASAALGAMTLALAREVGLLRMRVGPASALEIPHEGPEVGSRTEIGAAIDGPRAEGARAWPSSPRRAVTSARRCAPRSTRSPRIRRSPSAASTRSPSADAWLALDVPGSPYAVALDAQGTVLAKGTFNNLAQLESILAAGERRRAGLAEATHA